MWRQDNMYRAWHTPWKVWNELWRWLAYPRVRLSFTLKGIPWERGWRFYGVPAYYGALNWIKKASSIPKILKSLTDNSLNIKWHIISPAAYWEAKQEKIRENCTLKGIEYNDRMLEDLKDEIFI